MNTADVLIVGGGVIGCSVAYYLAREGLSVTLLERDEVAAHASGVAAGMLAPICESTGSGPFFELGVLSLGMFPELTAELRELTGLDPQYSPSGVLRVARSDEEAEHLRSQAELLADYGLQWLEASEAQEREPQLAAPIRGAVWSPREGHIHSRLFTRSLAQAAAGLGARIESGVPALGLIVTSDDRVIGVRTAAGDYGAGHVVLCAGAWTRLCGEWMGERLPVAPVRGQILSLEAPRPAFRSIIWGHDTYLVPRADGTVVVGATVEDAGYDCRTTAVGLATLLAAAPLLVPALADCAFREAWAGLRPGTPDGLPLIGPIPGVSDLTLASGHYRNGILLSPATGQIIADWVARHDFPRRANPFLPQRFLRSRTSERGAA